MTDQAPPLEVVVFDIDGTVLDSAPGIIDGFAHALAAVGVVVPPPDVLRSDLGPPVGEIMGRHGVPVEKVADAVTAYRSRYHAHGIHHAALYPGILDALSALQPRVRLATATAKRIDTATRFLTAHSLDGFFEVVGGSSDTVHAKADIIADTLVRLGDPDPAAVVMVGDRHSDIAGAAACGVRSVAVTWGYGSLAELEASHPDHLVHTPADLVALILTSAPR